MIAACSETIVESPNLNSVYGRVDMYVGRGMLGRDGGERRGGTFAFKILEHVTAIIQLHTLWHRRCESMEGVLPCTKRNCSRHDDCAAVSSYPLTKPRFRIECI
jgi:hypothetical protein